MASKKKKPRTKLAKKHDTLKPVMLPLEKLGTDEDCFGKLNDPRATECQQCGDAEICLIAMSQLNHIKRIEVEKGGHFKDIEEQNIKPGDRVELKKVIRKRIREMIRKQGPIDKQEIINDIYGKYLHDGFTQKIIGKLIDRLASKNENIQFIKNQYTWSSKK